MIIYNFVGFVLFLGKINKKVKKIVIGKEFLNMKRRNELKIFQNIKILFN